jgi:hypothetical protein
MTAWSSGSLKNARFGVACLGPGRQRAHFHMTKAQQSQAVGDAHVFVVTGGNAENVGKGEAAEGKRPLRRHPRLIWRKTARPAPYF